MDLDTVRTFVAAADAGQFQEAAAELAVTQQAVSKRIAALERDLGVRLFTRTPRGAELTIDGQAFITLIPPTLGPRTPAFVTPKSHSRSSAEP
ncbi:LysR family transcriptional regulator, partial [Streptomyces asiaticus]